MTITFWLAVGFAIIHLLSKYMKFLTNFPRSRLLSVAGGISVAYVFLHLLPELSEYQGVREEAAGVSKMESEIYLWAMAGLAIFYGLQRLVMTSAKKKGKPGTSNGVYWIHMGSFAVYNALIGYLLVEGEYNGIKGLVFYFIAMGVHFISNDHGLRETHEGLYDRKGRWLLSLAVLAGWIIGMGVELNQTIIAFLFAFLAGGIILNVMKEELPEERESNFWAFLSGMIAYTILLFLI